MPHALKLVDAWMARRPDKPESISLALARYRADTIHLISLPSHDRLLAILTDLAPDKHGEPIWITQAQLAELAGLTRETTSTALNTLEREGQIVLGRGRITVLEAGAS